MKSSSGNIGAKAVFLLCRQIEANGRGGSAGNTADLLAELDEVFPLITELLQADAEQQVA